MANQNELLAALAALLGGQGTDQATATPGFVERARKAKMGRTVAPKAKAPKAPTAPATIGAEFVPANGNYPDAVRTFKVSADGTRYAPRIITLSRLMAALDAVPAGK